MLSWLPDVEEEADEGIFLLFSLITAQRIGVLHQKCARNNTKQQSSEHMKRLRISFCSTGEQEVEEEEEEEAGEGKGFPLTFCPPHYII